MAKCATCGKTIMLGGSKGSDGRYCSAACRFQGFFPRFQAALERAATANPDPLPAAAPPPKRIEGGGDEFGSSMGDDKALDLVVIVIGVCTAAAVAVLIYWILGKVRYPFHGQTFWFVIPVGAYLCGMVAGAGFWMALRGFDRLPTTATYAAALVGGALAYLFIYVLTWWLMEFQGAKVRDEVGFLQFLQFTLEHQQIRVGRGNAPAFEVGKWGYARFAINVAGFAFGVLTMVAIAGGKAYCPRCKRYLRSVGKQVRSSSDPEAAAAALHPVIVGVLSGRIQEALDLHAVAGVPGGKEYWTTTLAVEACPACGMHVATLSASVPGDQGAQPFQGFVFRGTTEHPVRLTA
jgi:hypothetical protein